MISDAIIKREVDKSHQSGKTSSFLCALTFTILDEALTKHYGSNFSDRCLPASMFVLDLLNRFGIESKLNGIEACFVAVQSGTPVGWEGFVGVEPGHVWVRTEFNEIVDFTISQLNQHPSSVIAGLDAMPPIWWDIAATHPGFFLYLADGVIDPQLEDPSEVADLAAFRSMAMECANETLRLRRPEDIHYNPVLRDEATFEALLRNGHSWAKGAYIAHATQFPYPTDVIDRLETRGIILPLIVKRPLVSVDPLADMKSLISSRSSTEPARFEDHVVSDATQRDEVPQNPVRRNKIGRNSTCPCGSGLKYKRCCGSKKER